jgi:pantetheine-phosphate adenylyltransferase
MDSFMDSLGRRTKMKIGFYPGSFNPWHDGHEDILEKALKLFDKIVILQLTNPEKGVAKEIDPAPSLMKRVEIYVRPNTFLTNVVGTYVLGRSKDEYAIIRGLRNGNDLEYEKVQQYWNEDLGMKIPTVYFVSDRKLLHISSSAIRMIDKLLELQNAEEPT